MAVENASTFTKILSSKKVCVINVDSKPYEEDFKGEKIVIPPNGERKVFMPKWKAAKFMASCAYPPATDYTGEMIKGGRVKMLRVLELNEEERTKLGELTEEELQVKADEVEKTLKMKCGMCGFQAKTDHGLKIHTMKTHPEATPAE